MRSEVFHVFLFRVWVLFELGSHDVLRFADAGHARVWG